MTHQIPTALLADFEKKVTTLTNKATKYGYPVPTFTYSEPHVVTFTDDDGNKHLVEVVDVTTPDETETVKVNGWEFTATIEHTDNGNIINNISGADLPVRFRTAPCQCEHCNTIRNRKDSYVVRNTETGEYKQVGKQCLKDFTQGMTADHVLFSVSVYDLFQSFSVGSSFRMLPEYHRVIDVLTYAAEAVRLWGYKSSSCETYDRPTKVTVDEALRIDNGEQSKLLQHTKMMMERDNFNGKNPDSMNTAYKALEWLMSIPADTEYLNNLTILCSKEAITVKHFGYVVSLIPTYFKAMEKEEERKAREARKAQAQKTSQYVGTVGDKVEMTVKNFRLLTSFETMYGVSFIYGWEDEDGNQYTWKTSNSFDSATTIKGTIKAHTEYRGVKQTEMTRCKVMG